MHKNTILLGGVLQMPAIKTKKLIYYRMKNNITEGSV